MCNATERPHYHDDNKEQQEDWFIHTNADDETHGLFASATVDESRENKK